MRASRNWVDIFKENRIRCKEFKEMLTLDEKEAEEEPFCLLSVVARDKTRLARNSWGMRS